MYKRGDKEFILDIYLACKRIMEYLEGVTFERFLETPEKQDAVIRNIEIIGEAVKKLSEEFRDAHPDIEWSEIARTRDKFIHFYFGIDLDVVWDIATVDIPRLIEKICEEKGWHTTSL